MAQKNEEQAALLSQTKVRCALFSRCMKAEFTRGTLVKPGYAVLLCLVADTCVYLWKMVIS